MCHVILITKENNTVDEDQLKLKKMKQQSG